MQLKRLPNLATRDGATLRVSLFPSGTQPFVDTEALNGGRSYSLWDFVSEINAVVLYTTDGDDATFTLLQRTNGRHFELPSDPKALAGSRAPRHGGFLRDPLHQRARRLARDARRRPEGVCVEAEGSVARCRGELGGRRHAGDRVHGEGCDGTGKASAQARRPELGARVGAVTR